MTDRPRRDGFALLLAILAVVVAGALIVATHAAVRLDHGVAAAAIARQRAFAASEHGLWFSLANWDPGNSVLPAGGARSTVIRAGADSAIVTTVRLNEELFWVTAEAWVGDATRRARRRTGINVRATFDSSGVHVAPVLRSWAELP